MDARRTKMRKLGIDFTILCCVALPLLFFWVFGIPFHRGFFCNDESIRHPYRSNTVENWMLGLIATLLPFLVIAITEFVKAHASNTVCTSGSRCPPWLLECYKHIGCLLYCEACTLLLTFIGKYSIGRLRPHFFAVCLPRMPDGTTCNDPINHNRYIEEFVCQNSDSTALQLLDMRQSFPSGHASLAASAMVFCAIYLQARMTWRGSYLSRHFCQFMLVSLAIFTGLSRISDYMHHWSDVLTGLILGTVVAVIVAIYVSDMLTEKHEQLQFVIPQIRTDSQNERILSEQSNNNNNIGTADRIMN